MSKPDLSPYEPRLPRMRPRDWRLSILVGCLVSNLLGFAATGLLVLLLTRNWAQFGDIGSWTAGTIAFSNFFIIPLGMGIVASYFWRDIPERSYRSIGCGLIVLNLVASLVGAGFVLKEGVVCLIMASPILGLMMALGVSVGRNLWKKTTFFSVSLLPLLAMILVSDGIAPHQFTTATTTDFHSSAPPQALWKYVANYPANPHPSNWWLWSMGVAMPVKSTGSARVGGRRDCELSGGVRVGQRITAADRNRRLDFVIDQQPQHPEISRHMIFQRGRIQLIPDGHGGTILRATSWYQLKVFPANYFNLWAAAVMHATHLRVFSWMDELARRDIVTAKSPPLTPLRSFRFRRRLAPGRDFRATSPRLNPGVRQ